MTFCAVIHFGLGLFVVGFIAILHLPFCLSYLSPFPFYFTCLLTINLLFTAVSAFSIICYTESLRRSYESLIHSTLFPAADEMKPYCGTRVIATGQFEDDAQHSWHISAMAEMLASANEPVNLEKTIKMLLFHDVVSWRQRYLLLRCKCQ